jgi:hypothetical protein
VLRQPFSDVKRRIGRRGWLFDGKKKTRRQSDGSFLKLQLLLRSGFLIGPFAAAFFTEFAVLGGGHATRMTTFFTIGLGLFAAVAGGTGHGSFAATFFAILAIFGGGYTTGMAALLAVGLGFLAAGPGRSGNLTLAAAFFTLFAVFGGGDAAFVRAVLSVFAGRGATASLFGEGAARHQAGCAEGSDQDFQCSHFRPFSDGLVTSTHNAHTARRSGRQRNERAMK